MGFLRRILGGGSRDDDAPDPGDNGDEVEAADEPATIDDDEQARELELARFDQERIDDLVRRQQRYADRSWTPPPQGGERRADDEDAARS